MKRIFFLFAIAVTIISATSCGHKPGSHKVIAVSLPPQASLLRHITGDSIDIITLMPAEANPETFEITVNSMKQINDAAVYMKMGNMPFESTLTQQIGESGNALRFVDVSEGIDLIYGTHSHDHHSHDVADPHTWTSVPNLKKIAANMLEAVIDTDPVNKDYYTANYDRLVARLDSVDRSIASRIQSSATGSFLIWHPSLSYFARDYGLQQIAVGQENKEMTPRQLGEVHQRALESGVKVMFIQQNFDASQAQSIASALGIDVVVINPMDADIFQQFNIITDALTRN